MRISLFMMFVCVFQLFAVNTEAQNATIELKSNNLSIEELFKEIEKQTDYLVIYSTNGIRSNFDVSLSKKKATVSDYLDEALQGQNLRYEFINNYIILSGLENPAPQQEQKRITGTVTDERGEPVIGATIVTKGTTRGTVTDIDGRFSLQASDNAVLVVSYIGYASQEIAVTNAQTSLNIVLKEDSQELDEVVVVGYGVQKKINLTGSVSTVGSDKLTNRPTPNFATALAGMAPGVRVTQSTGNPGSENVAIQIRGQGSINGGSPMILVDGVIADMNVINPDDVESVSILKDAASAAIYGSRAANGVILVTTKKGKKEKPTVTASVMLASESPLTFLNYLSDTPQFMRLRNQAQLNANPAATSFWYDEQTILDWEEANKNPNGMYTHPITGNTIPNWLAYPNTDWARELFQTSTYQRYNLSVSGGSDQVTYMLSGSFQDNPGTLENTGMERFNIRANIETKIADFLTVGTQTWATKEFKDPGNVTLGMSQVFPGITPKYNGKLGYIEDPNRGDNVNPLLNILSTGGQQEGTRINSTWFANAQIWNGISAEARFNYNEYQREGETYSKQISRYRFRESTEIPFITTPALGNATSNRNAYFSSSYTANLMLRYAGSFGDHDINAFAAYEQYYTKSTEFTAVKLGLMDWNVTDITSAATMYSIGGSPKQALAILSYFGRLNYAYKDRYLLEANFRTDGSSRFAPGYRWGNFAAFSAGWRMSEETFFAPFKTVVDNLKLKASYGQLGNQVSGYYDWQSIYAKANMVMNESVQAAVILSQMPNFQMSWEKTATTNIGFEANLLKQRLSLDVEYYTRKTTDMLVQPPVPWTLGNNIRVPMMNSASLRNNGIDISVGWNDKVGDLRYSINANIGYSANEITKYNGMLTYEADPKVLDIWGNPTWRYTNLAAASTGSTQRTTEGHMHNEWFLRKPYQGTGTYYMQDGAIDPKGGPKDGMIRSKADLDWVRGMIAAGYQFFNNIPVNPVGTNNLWYGEVLMDDINGDGKYGNDDDRAFLGKSALPKFTFGLNLSAEWKGIDLSMFWAGRLGSYHYINTSGVNVSTANNEFSVLPADAATLFYSYDAVAAAANGGVNDYDPALDPNANVTGKYPRFVNGPSTMLESTVYLYNTSFLKLKSLQVGYTLPKKWLGAVKISNLRVFMSGENLLTIHSKDFPAVDPELGGAVAVYPTARVLSGGVTITF